MPSGCANIWTPRGTTLLYTTRPGVLTAKQKKQGVQLKAKGGKKNQKKVKPAKDAAGEEAGSSVENRGSSDLDERRAARLRLQASSVLREAASRLLQAAERAESTADENAASFEQQLGGKLAQQGLDFMRDWDDDRIKKLKFRQYVRALGLQFGNDVIDAFFERLDTDGSGIVAKADIRKAFATQLNVSGDAQADGERLRVRAQGMRQRAAMTSATADASEEFEAKHADLTALLKQRELVEQQAGTLIIQKWGRDVTSKELLVFLLSTS